MLVAKGKRYPPKKDSEGWVEWWWVRTSSPPGPNLITAMRMLLALRQEFPVQKSESDLKISTNSNI